MPATTSQFGPGTLSIGAVGSPIDISCQIESCQLSSEIKQDDPVTVLCGEEVPGAITWTYKLKGKLFQDQADPDGIVRFSWANPGVVVPFTFVPNNTDAVGATGELTLIPITIGSDTAKAKMKSDFEWTCVGEPQLDDVVLPLAADAA